MKPSVRAFVLAICIGAGLTSLAGTSAAQDCYYDAKTVKKLIETPPGFHKGMWQPEGSPWVEKALYRSGDCIALEIVRAYTWKKLLDPDRLSRILILVRLSFSQPGEIVRDENKDPVVSMFLLSVLEHECENKELKEKIIDTEKYVSSQADGQHSLPSK